MGTPLRCVVATLGILGLATWSAALAGNAAPSNPGYYRMAIGDFEITALNDGSLALPMDKVLDMPDEEARAMFEKNYLTVPVETSFNAYLIDTGKHLVLIDAGAGSLFGPELGRLDSSLAAAGYRPEQVDQIYLTHMHPDHLGGLLKGEARAFPEATVRVNQDDLDYWLDPAQREAAPEEHKEFFRNAKTALAPYIDANAVETFDGGEVLVPGIRARAASGHTPGHSTYLVESQGETLMVWGDLLHAATVQFPRPGITVSFDTERGLARDQRRDIFAETAEQGYWAAGAHLSFPGIGHLRSGSEGYEWLPVHYSREPMKAD